MPGKRIMVIGCCGSGKTTLSRELGKLLNIPVIHLDVLNWRDGWQQVSSEEFDKQLEKEIIKPQWIIDGNYTRTIPVRLKKCDTIIYLDLPRSTCLVNVLKRVMTYHGKSRPDMGGCCPERIDFEFLRYVWDFNKQHRAEYKKLMVSSDKEAITLHSRRECRSFLNSLRSIK